MKPFLFALIVVLFTSKFSFTQNNNVLDHPQNMSKYRNNNGSTYLVSIKGSKSGNAWGGSDGVYTDDSYLAKAAVHAGILKDGEEGIVKVTILPGKDKYTGCEKNGVGSLNYGKFMGSYKLEKSQISSAAPDILDHPQNMSKFRKNNGTIYQVKIKGSTSGSAWGGQDGIYTDDSNLAKAAVHAGVLKPGEEGVVKVKILPGKDKYTGCQKNGVGTLNYGNFMGSYQFIK